MIALLFPIQNGLDLINTASDIKEELTNAATIKTTKTNVLTDEKGSRTSSTQALVANHVPDHSDHTTQSDDEYVDPFDLQSDLAESLLLHTELLKQIQLTVSRMNTDIRQITQRLAAIENIFTVLSKQIGCSSPREENLMQRYSNRFLRWWPFHNISPQWFLILLLWPFIGRRFFLALKKQRPS